MEFRGLLITFHLPMSVRPFVSSLSATICSHLVCSTLSRLSCISLLLIYLIIPDWRGRWMQSHSNGQHIGCVVRSAASRPGSLPPPSRVCGECNLNPEQFAGLTFRLGWSFSGTPPPLFLRVHQPGSAQPWLGLGVKIHLHSIGIHLVQLLATSSSANCITLSAGSENLNRGWKGEKPNEQNKSYYTKVWKVVLDINLNIPFCSVFYQ